MKERCNRGFEKLLTRYPVKYIDEGKDCIFGLWNDLTLWYFNMGWIRFAEGNQGAPDIVSPDYLGVPILDVCGKALAAFYKNLFESCLEGSFDELHPAQHRYECSSPEKFRQFLMTLYPLGNKDGILVVNSLVIETTHAARNTQPFPAIPSDYLNENNFIRQCSHCRRVENQRIENQWDWVPEWVKEPPLETSHGLCPVCLEYYYPEYS